MFPKPKPRKKEKEEQKKAEQEEYLRLRREFLDANPRCAVYPELRATDIHHKVKRGKYFLDTRYWLPVSRKGHTKIEMFPKWAKENGYTLERNSKEFENETSED